MNKDRRRALIEVGELLSKTGHLGFFLCDLGFDLLDFSPKVGALPLPVFSRIHLGVERVTHKSSHPCGPQTCQRPDDQTQVTSSSTSTTFVFGVRMIVGVPWMGGVFM